MNNHLNQPLGFATPLAIGVLALLLFVGVHIFGAVSNTPTQEELTTTVYNGHLAEYGTSADRGYGGDPGVNSAGSRTSGAGPGASGNTHTSGGGYGGTGSSGSSGGYSGGGGSSSGGSSGGSAGGNTNGGGNQNGGGNGGGGLNSAGNRASGAGPGASSNRTTTGGGFGSTNTGLNSAGYRASGAGPGASGNTVTSQNSGGLNSAGYRGTGAGPGASGNTVTGSNPGLNSAGYRGTGAGPGASANTVTSQGQNPSPGYQNADSGTTESVTSAPTTREAVMAVINDPTKFAIKFSNLIARGDIADINLQALKDLVALQQLCDCKITIRDGAVSIAALQAAAKAMGVSVSDLTTRKGFASMHYKGEAIDVTIDNPTEVNRVAFAKAAATVGFTGIGVYNNPGLFHVDIGPARAWGPNLHSSSLPGDIADAIAAGRAAAPGYAAAHPNGPTTGTKGSVASGPRSTAGGDVQAGVGAITGGIKSGSLSGPSGGYTGGSASRMTGTDNNPGKAADDHVSNAPSTGTGSYSGTAAPSQKDIQNAIDSRAGYSPTPASSVTTGGSVKTGTSASGNTTPSQSDIQHAIDTRAGYSTTNGTSVTTGSGSVKTGTSAGYTGSTPSYQGGSAPAPAPTGSTPSAPASDRTSSTPTAGGVTGGVRSTTPSTPSNPGTPTSPKSERDTSINFGGGSPTPNQNQNGGGNGGGAGAGIGPVRPSPPAYLLSQEGEGAGEQSDADTPPPPPIGPLCQWFGIACPTVQITTSTTRGGALQGVNSNIPLTEI